MMTDAEMLDKVKSWVGASGDFNDNTLTLRIKAIKLKMLDLGIPLEKIESDTGIAALAIAVQDLWNLSPGEVVLSPAFQFFITGLKPGI